MYMNDSRAMEILAQAEAILSEGHFVYNSGDHGSAYVNKDRVYRNSVATDELCWRLAERFNDRELAIDVVAGAEKGGIILAHATARHLSQFFGRHKREVLMAYAEKTKAGDFEFRRGFDECIAGKRVLIVEDVITTGATVRKLVRAVHNLGGHVVGVAAICNRGGVEPRALGVPMFSALTEIPLETYPESDCPLCARGEPVRQDVGKGREYLARKRSVVPQTTA